MTARVCDVAALREPCGRVPKCDGHGVKAAQHMDQEKALRRAVHPRRGTLRQGCCEGSDEKWWFSIA